MKLQEEVAFASVVLESVTKIIDNTSSFGLFFISFPMLG